MKRHVEHGDWQLPHCSFLMEQPITVMELAIH